MERCSRWLPSKGRLCAAQALSGFKYCGNHQEAKAGATRIPCPVDPSHTILEGRLKSHLKKCPATKLSNAVAQSPYYSRSLNAGSEEDEEDSGGATLDKRLLVEQMPKDEFQKLVNRIEAAYHDCCARVQVQECLREPSACSKWLNSQVDRRHPLQAKHTVQQASMLGNLEEFGVLRQGDQETAFIEFGAGRGYLSHMLSDCYQVAKVFLVERRSYKFKADRTLRYSCGVALTRLRVDIEDLELQGVAALAACRFVATGKHICGAATDLALRCCLRQPDSLAGIGFATCCHHLCQWKAYVNKEFIRRLGFSKAEFETITWLTSWALSGQLDERAELGFKCKRLLDTGRVAWLRDLGLRSDMVEYVSARVSPENKLIMASQP